MKSYAMKNGTELQILCCVQITDSRQISILGEASHIKDYNHKYAGQASRLIRHLQGIAFFDASVDEITTGNAKSFINVFEMMNLQWSRQRITRWWTYVQEEMNNAC